MREILFRGKIKGSGEWVEGNLATVKWWLDGSPITVIIPKDAYLDPRSGAGTIRYIEVDPETVGQWTGLVDRYDQKIFEDDILKCTYDLYPTCRVIFNEYCASFQSLEDDGFSDFFLSTISPAKMKVIGNIHDSPELLT